MSHPLVVTTLTTIFTEKVTETEMLDVPLPLGVCGTTEVALRKMTVTMAVCWLQVGVKVTSAHVPVSSRFVSFSRALCFFSGPGDQNDLTFHLVKTGR